METATGTLQPLERWEFSGGAIIGERRQQEDYYEFRPTDDGRGLLAILADGMGGHEAGEIASREAVQAFVARFVDHPAASVEARLGAALEAANAKLSAVILGEPRYEGMGCTLLAAHVSNAGLAWISVGDSPLYLVRKGKIRQLNQDHSMAPVINQRLHEGRLTAEQAREHPQRNALRSALTGGEGPELIDCPSRQSKLQKGDVVILASDGIQTLSEREIAHIAGQKLTPAQIVDQLLISVKDKGRIRQDNAAAQIIKVDNLSPNSTVFNTKKNNKTMLVTALIAVAAIAVTISLCPAYQAITQMLSATSGNLSALSAKIGD